MSVINDNNALWYKSYLLFGWRCGRQTQSVSFGSLSVQSRKSIHHCQELEDRQLSRPICVEGKTWPSGCKLSILWKVSIIVANLGVLNWTGSVLVATGSCIWHMVMADYVKDANCSFGCAGGWKLTACIFSMLPVKGICAHVVCFDIRKLWSSIRRGLNNMCGAICVPIPSKIQMYMHLRYLAITVGCGVRGVARDLFCGV